MKKPLLMIAMAMALVTSGAAWSQTAPTGGGGMQMPNGQNGGGQMHEQRFQEHKEKLLNRLNERLANVQKRIACVQAATDPKAMRACMPHRGEEHEGH